MLMHRLGQSSRDKRRLKELAEHFEPLIAPYRDRITALEERIADLEDLLSGEVVATGTDGQPPAKRGPGRPPKT